MKENLIMLIMLAVFVGIFLLCLRWYKSSVQLLEKGVTAQATIIEKKQEHISFEDRTLSDILVYEFTDASGNKIQHEDTVIDHGYWQSVTIGQTIMIKYDPAQPKNTYFADKLDSNRKFALIMTCVFLLPIAIIVYKFIDFNFIK